MADTLSNMKKILLFISIVLSVFVSLEYKNLSLLLAHGVGDMEYYLGDTPGLREYNTSIELIEQKNYTGAKSLLSPVLNDSNIVAPADIWETYGDLVYELGGGTGDVIVFYERALSHESHPRITDKISLLKNPPKEPSRGDAPEQQNNTEIQSGSVERAERRIELSNETQNIEQSLNLQSGGDSRQDVITRTLELLATGSTTVRDW